MEALYIYLFSNQRDIFFKFGTNVWDDDNLVVNVTS